MEVAVQVSPQDEDCLSAPLRGIIPKQENITGKHSRSLKWQTHMNKQMSQKKEKESLWSQGVQWLTLSKDRREFISKGNECLVAFASGGRDTSDLHVKCLPLHKEL